MASKAKLYRGRSASSELVELTVDGSFLQILKDGAVVGRWPLELIHRDPTQTVAVVLGCGSDDERLELIDTDILKYLKIKDQVWNMESLKKNSYQFWIWGLVSIAAIVLVVLNSSNFARTMANKVPLEYEKKLADAALTGSKMEECKPTPRQLQVAQALKLRLHWGESGAGASTSIHFVDEDVKNAYTFPGGSIYFFTGLIKDMETPDEFAGVLAHEMEHADRRHVMQSVIKGLVFTGLLNFVLGDFSSIALIDPSTAFQLLTLKHSREMEQEADDGALRRLEAAGISARGMSDFFKREDSGLKIEKKLAFLSTHPFSGERAQHFQDAIEREVPLRPALDDADWKELKSICHDPISE